MSFDITTQEIASFEGGFYRPTQILGPITLARFSDSQRGDNGRYGRFWLYGSYLLDLIASGQSLPALIKEISQNWAVCDDWGDKRLLTLMDIPVGGSVPAMWGRAKFQPKVSSAAVRSTSHSYAGGALQLVIPLTDTDRRRSARLSTYIVRKLQTADLLSNPRACLENSWVTAQRNAGRNIGT